MSERERLKGIHRVLLKALASISDGSGGVRSHDKGLTDYTVYDYISMAVAHGYDSYTIEKLILMNSIFTPEQVIARLEHFIEGKPKPKHENGRPGAYRPVIYEGQRYDTLRDMAKKMGKPLNKITYMRRKGLIKFADEI